MGDMNGPTPGMRGPMQQNLTQMSTALGSGMPSAGGWGLGGDATTGGMQSPSYRPGFQPMLNRMQSVQGAPGFQGGMQGLQGGGPKQ